MAVRAPVFSPLIRAVRSPVLSTQAGGAPAAPFNPSSLSGLLSRFLDTAPGYHGSTLGGLPILNAEESGTLALPRGQTCLQGDGINDFAVSVSNVGLTGATSRTLCFRAKLTSTATQCMLSYGSTSGTSTLFALFCNGGQWWFNGSGDDHLFGTADTNWHHHAITYNGTLLKWYIDGVEAVSVSKTLNTSDSLLNVFRRLDNNWYSAAKMNDVRIYNVTKTAGEVLAIANQYLTPTTLDDVGLISRWWLNEESGSIAYDSYGNNDLTLTNGPTWTTDPGVTYNPANWLGHTVANNLLLRSEEFDNAAWTRNSAQGTVTANADGIGDMFTESTNTHIQGLYQAVTVVSGAVYTLGVDLKYGTRRYVRVAFGTGGGTDSVYADVDLQNGTIVNQGPYGGATQPVAPTIVANGSYYRVTLTGSIPSTTGYVTIYGRSSSANSNPESALGYTGTSSTWYMNRAQIERGPTASPYAATTSTALTNVVIPRNESNTSQDAAGNALGVVGPLKRPATTEVRCVTGDGSSYASLSASLTNGTSALTAAAFIRTSSTSARAIIGQWTTVGNNLSWLVFQNADGTVTVFLSNNGSTVAWQGTYPAINSGSWLHIAVVYNGTTVVVYYNGVGQTASATSGIVPASLRNGGTFVVGSWDSLSSAWTGSACGIYIKQAALTAGNVAALQNGTYNTSDALAHWTCQEGPGTANTNRTIYDTVGTNHLTLVNGTVSTIWANYCPYARDWCIENGGGVAVNGSFIPGRIA